MHNLLDLSEDQRIPQDLGLSVLTFLPLFLLLLFRLEV